MRLTNRKFPSADPGLLTLVDLAGSETTADSQHHDRARLAQTKGAINKHLCWDFLLDDYI